MTVPVAHPSGTVALCGPPQRLLFRRGRRSDKQRTKIQKEGGYGSVVRVLVTADPSSAASWLSFFSPLLLSRARSVAALSSVLLLCTRGE